MIHLNLSNLSNTWLIDIDGTICKHNGYKYGEEELLPGVIEFWNQIPSNDKIILLTARNKDHKNRTIDFLKEKNIRFDHIIFDLPTGERILINDKKPSGLDTAISINIRRNSGLKIMVMK